METKASVCQSLEQGWQPFLVDVVVLLLEILTLLHPRAIDQSQSSSSSALTTVVCKQLVFFFLDEFLTDLLWDLFYSLCMCLLEDILFVYKIALT